MEEYTLDVAELAHLLLSKLWMIILISVVGLLIAFGYTKILVTPQYSSSVKFYVSNNQDTNQIITYNDINTASKLVNIYVEILKSDTVLDKVITAIDLNNNGTQCKPEDLRKMLSIESKDDTGIMEVTVTSDNAERSADIANTIASVAPERIIQITKAGYVELVDEAKPDPIPSSPKVKRNCLIGFLIGFALTVFYLVMHQMFDQRIKGAEDIKKCYDIPVLGEIPNFHSQFKGGYERYEY